MPDTQSYVKRSFQPQGAAHLARITRYICEHRTSWTEPNTGKRMPILMVIQLGDLVEMADRGDGRNAPFAEWERVDAAFRNFDECDPVVPYLVTVGNHDIQGQNYQGVSRGFNRTFGVERWRSRGYACADPSRCDWDAGEWFIGGGDPIRAGSRNRVEPGEPGPPEDQPGRHRAGIIRRPDGGQMLFLGLEMAFDFPPVESAEEGDDARWPLQVLHDYADVPTVVFHHSLFWVHPEPDSPVRWGPEFWQSDSLAHRTAEGRGMYNLWKLLVEPFPQVFLVATGHVVRPRVQANYRIERPSGPPVYGVLRNFQWVGAPGTMGYGMGWNGIAAFDPERMEVRLRSYRIDPAAAEDGETACFERDYGGVGELRIPWKPWLVARSGPGQVQPAPR
jgi:hypothetical protein